MPNPRSVTIHSWTVHYSWVIVWSSSWPVDWQWLDRYPLIQNYQLASIIFSLDDPSSILLGLLIWSYNLACLSTPLGNAYFARFASPWTGSGCPSVPPHWRNWHYGWSLGYNYVRYHPEIQWIWFIPPPASPNYIAHAQNHPIHSLSVQSDSGRKPVNVSCWIQTYYGSQRIGSGRS